MGNCQFNSKSSRKSKSQKSNKQITYQPQSPEKQYNDIDKPNYCEEITIAQTNITKNEKQKVDHEKRKKKKNINIFANKMNSMQFVFESYEVIPNMINSKEIDFIVNSLKGNFLFSNLNETEFEEIISNMFYAKVPKNTYIFKQNDQAASFFIIAKGEFQVEINDSPKKILKASDSFGELALLYNAPRSAGLKAIQDCFVWGINRFVFKKVLMDLNNKEKNENVDIVARLKFLEGMTETQKEMLASNLITLRYSPDQIVVNKGDQADSYFIIKSGIVGCYDGDRHIRDLVAGDSFGEQALYENGIRSLTVKAKEESQCLAISRESLLKIFGEDIETILMKNSQNWAIENNEILSQLNKVQIQKWIINTELLNIGNKDFCVIREKDFEIENFYIVLKGEFQYGEQIFQKGDIFGLDFVLNNNKDKILKHDLIAKNAKYSQIQIKKLFKLLNTDNFENLFERNEKMKEKKRRRTQQLQNKKDILQQFAELLFIKVLGEGQFGEVSLVVNKNDIKKHYALKTISRNKIAEHNIENNIIFEKKVLEFVNFPYITHLYRTFKDSYAVHFLINVICGVDMFDMIRQIDLLDNDESKFYVGSMLLCLEYLHTNNIIYRDLKPENTMVDKNGYLHLIDLGTAKIMDKDNQRTYTILGTPHYMAPEIILGKGYTFHIDLWALGICMFEFQCGYVPFGEEEEDPFEIYKLIVNDSYHFPPYFNVDENRDAMNMIDILLNRVPEARLKGSNYASLKAHKWFEDFDWDSLIAGTLEAPYKPPLNSYFSPKNIEQMAAKNILIKDHIKEQYQNVVVRKSINRNIPDWEKEFEDSKNQIFLKQKVQIQIKNYFKI